MTLMPRKGKLFERIRHMCECPQAFAPNFTLTHFYLYIIGYDNAFADAGISGEYLLLREWIYKKYPQWRQSPEAWEHHILHANGEDLPKTLAEILRLVDQFLATDGAEFNRPRSPPGPP